MTARGPRCPGGPGGPCGPDGISGLGGLVPGRPVSRYRCDYGSTFAHHHNYSGRRNTRMHAEG